MKNNHNTNLYTAEQTAELLTISATATAHKLRNLESKSADSFISQLRQAYGNDHTADRLSNIVNELAELEAEHKALNERAETLEAISKRLTATEEERAEATAELHELRKAIKHNTDHRKTLEPKVSTTYTDRKDLEQEAVTMLLTIHAIRRAVEDFATAHRYININRLALMGKLAPTEATEEAESITNYKHTLRAVGNAINSMRSHTTHNRTTTTAELLTAEALTEYINIYGGIGKEYKHTLHNNAIQYVVFKNYKKKPSGFYLITETKTTAPYISYEAFTEESGEKAEIVKNNGINIIENQGSREAVENLVEVANLTDRERQFLLYFLDNTSAKHGQKAVNDYIAETMSRGEKPTTETAENHRFRAMKKSAFDRIGITAKQTQSDFFKRIRNRLKAHRTEPTKSTEAEREHRAIISAFRNRSSLADLITLDRLDLIKWTEHTTHRERKTVVHWISREEAEANHRLAEYERRREQNKTKIDNSTEEAQRKGKEAEERYRAKQKAEADRRAEAKKAEKQKELEAIKQRAKRDGVKTDLNTSVEDWRSYTAEQRALWKIYIEALAKTH